MASMSLSPVALSGSSTASDLLRSSSSGLSGVPLKILGRARLGARRRDFTVCAKIGKAKKHDYPWPDDPDPNVKGGILTHLSYFKPLKEKAKQVTLDFEKPLLDIQKKIVDVQRMANETGLDFSDQIISLENKYQQALKDLYTHLTPIQRVNIARHPNRPTFLDHVFNITDKFVELHGDRAGYNDPAIVTGIGTIDGRRYMFMGHQKGRNTKENVQRNFGMPTPHGYRKALRMMRYADHHGFPIITFIDTPGAYADLKSEELGQGEAIAHNLRTMFGLKVPIVSIVIGEGGSGGALAIGCANKLLMLENAVFYVASPEACAAILWKTASAAPKAAEKLRITAAELCRLQVADGIIPEPLGGAHADPAWTSQQIKIAVVDAMDELTKMETEELLKHRMLKFRNIGGFQEGIPVDPERKVNMKNREEPIVDKTPAVELEDEVEKLRQQIFNANKSDTELPESGLNVMIEKLQNEIEHEYFEALQTMGLKDRFVMLQEEFAKARTSQDELLHAALADKMAKLKGEFNQGLPEAPNYPSLMNKLEMLTEIIKAKKNTATLKQDINKRFKEVIGRPDLKEKIDALKAVMETSEISTIEGLDDELKEKILKVKQEIEFEMAEVLKSLGLDVAGVGFKAKDFIQETPAPDVKSKIEELNEEINRRIEDVVRSSDLKSKIELVRLELIKAGQTPDVESVDKIKALDQEIRQTIADAMNSSELLEKFAKVNAEISESAESSGGLNGNFSQETPKENSSEHAELN